MSDQSRDEHSFESNVRKESIYSIIERTFDSIDDATKEVIVAPGPSGTVKVHGEPHKQEINIINAKDAHAVVIGNRNELTVIYGATVNSSPISLEDMVEAVKRAESVCFQWFRLLFESNESPTSTTTVHKSGFSATADHLKDIRVRGGDGVIFGNDGRVQTEVTFDVKLTADDLARLPEVREAVHHYLENPCDPDASVALRNRITEAHAPELPDLPDLPAAEIVLYDTSLDVINDSFSYGAENHIRTRNNPVEGGIEFGF